MAQASRVWHTQSKLLVVASIVAACSIVGVCGIYLSRSPNSHLRRSNAIHRRRRERHISKIEWTNPTPNTPLGTIIIRKSELDYHIIDLARSPLPTIDELRQHFPHITEDTWKEIVDIALHLVLTSCSIGFGHSTAWLPIQEFGLDNLTSAMAVRDESEIRRCAEDVRNALRQSGISDAEFDNAVDKFFASDTWRANQEQSAQDDVADPAETEEADLSESHGRDPSQGLRGLLYYIAEEDAKRKAYEHRGINCEECGEVPIRGVRWHCLNCPDFDLCASCEAHTEHPRTHVFAKVKIPLPVLSQPTKEYRLWYPGDPRKLHPSLDVALKKRLCHEHSFEEPRIDALYDQFTCLVNVPWRADPCDIQAAIDKRAFNKALSCEKWSSQATSNALYDRMFSFYDTDCNGLIGFEEFISGFAYLRGPRRFASMHRAIQGYDMNHDGCIDRDDVMRLMRAKFAIQKLLVHDTIESHEIEQTQNAVETLRSSQPISSIFALEDIPPGESRPRHGKHLDLLGDMQPSEETKTILDDEDPWSRTRPSRESAPSHEILRNNMSRFEELLHGSDSNDIPHEVMEQVDGLHPIWLAEGTGGPTLRRENHLGDMESMSEDMESVDPHIQDILWQATENGLRSLLDAIFSDREMEDMEAIETRDERQKWRKDIEAVQEAERASLLSDEQYEGTTDHDVLSTSDAKSPQSKSSGNGSTTAATGGPHFTDDIVATDWESLERREQDIIDTSLHDLLNASGYGVRADDAVSNQEDFGHEASIPSLQDESPPHTAISMHNIASSHVHPDPTLPQNMPNEQPAEPPTPAVEPPTPAEDRVPSRQRLQHLSILDTVDEMLQSRGGPGRLNYVEVEDLALAAGDEVCGLIRSWLEWASF